jgi:hypothetical protein
MRLHFHNWKQSHFLCLETEGTANNSIVLMKDSYVVLLLNYQIQNFSYL